MIISLHTRRALVGLGLLVGITLAAGIANTATADQSCVPQWQPFTSGEVLGVGPWPNSSIVWNGDLVVSGQFATAGEQTVNLIARWDGSEWHPFTSGGQVGLSGNDVRALTEWNGDLIAGGSFFNAGGQTVNHIARWDGSEWHPFISGGQIGVGGGSSPGVHGLTVWNYNLIAGGSFTTAGGETVNNIARWNGYSWQPLVVGCDPVGVSGAVNALQVYDGDPVVLGTFLEAGGQTVNRIATWKACPHRGPCCVNGAILQVFADECAGADGMFFGEEVPPDEVECAPACLADVTGDGLINVDDLLMILNNWGLCE